MKGGTLYSSSLNELIKSHISTPCIPFTAAASAGQVAFLSLMKTRSVVGKDFFHLR